MRTEGLNTVQGTLLISHSDSRIYGLDTLPQVLSLIYTS